MLRLLLVLFSLTSFITANPQEPVKITISTTGCTVKVYCFTGRFDSYVLEDSSTVYAHDCIKDGVAYGIYCVKLKQPINDLTAAEDTIISYLDFLKIDYSIKKSKGYDKDHHLNNDYKTIGVFDTWEDENRNKWKIKAWTNGNFICVLHVHSAKELPEKITAIFLEGLRFPGKK